MVAQITKIACGNGNVKEIFWHRKKRNSYLCESEMNNKVIQLLCVDGCQAKTVSAERQPILLLESGKDYRW